MKEEAEKRGMTLYLPGMGLCIDNAAMIALAGYLHHQPRRNLQPGPEPPPEHAALIVFCFETSAKAPRPSILIQ